MPDGSARTGFDLPELVTAGRIVSLLPSATEILFFLGVGDRVAGVTYECAEPPEAASRPHVTDTIIPPGATPAEIDTTIKDAIATGTELYTLDQALLSSINPDLIVTQDLCRVCALPAGEVESALAQLGSTADVFQYDPMTLDQVLTEIEALAKKVGAEPGATDSLRDRLDKIIGVVDTKVAARGRPKVLLLEWPDPPFTPGHWIPDQIQAAGGDAVLAHPGARSEQSTWEAVASSGAEVLIVAPCGFDEAAAEQQLREVIARPELAELPAIVSGRCHAIDADALIVRPGPRLVDGVEALAALIHPQP